LGGGAKKKLEGAKLKIKIKIKSRIIIFFKKFLEFRGDLKPPKLGASFAPACLATSRVARGHS
jgi:hypothetical protein